jgi:predicted metal-dependent HD superfamily phosphohydrolase
MLTPLLRKQITTESARYVNRLFKENPKPSLIYHTIDHTHHVVAYAAEIAGHYPLTEYELYALEIAAWFHDTGYLFVKPKNHEEESIRVVNAFLNQFPEIPPQTIAQIERSILATKMPQIPCTRLEDILCDADTYHLGTPEFFTTNELMKQEVQAMGVDTSNWNTSSIQLLKDHTYHTSYCQNKLTKGKLSNIRILEETL